jgi:hypothetical protein
MRIKIDSGWIGTALSLGGAGAPLMWPDGGRTLAVVLFCLAAVVLILGVRIEGFHLKWGREGRKMPLIGMILSAIFLTGFATWYFWPTGVASNDELTDEPSILDLYVNGFPNVDIRIDGFTDINEPGAAGRVNYTIMGDFSSNTKFVLYYIPHAKDTLALIKSLRTSSKDIVDAVDGTINVNTKNMLNSSSVRIKDFIFSGSVYIFYEDDILSTEQISQITASYKEAGQIVQFRSSEFKLKVWDEIRLGRFPKMLRYEINGVGRIVPVRGYS